MCSTTNAVSPALSNVARRTPWTPLTILLVKLGRRSTKRLCSLLQYYTLIFLFVDGPYIAQSMKKVGRERRCDDVSQAMLTCL